MFVEHPPFAKNWLEYDQRLYLYSFFEYVCAEIGRRLAADRTRNEVSLTEEPLFQFFHDNDTLNKLIAALNYKELFLEVKAKKFSQIEEGKVGADLGMIAEITTREISVRKALILQAKKLFPGGQYEGLLGAGADGVRQGASLVSLTAASFFMLYNPVYSKPNRPIVTFKGHQVWSVKLQRREARDGITILPATTQQGLKPPPAFSTVHPYTIPLAQFLTDDFFQCKVGDSKDSVLLIASGKDDQFRVRYGISFKFLPGD